MQMILEIPDGMDEQLRQTFPNLERSALEALAAQAYARGVLSKEEVRVLLKLDSSWDAQSVLSCHGVWPSNTVEDLRSDMNTLDEFLVKA